MKVIDLQTDQVNAYCHCLEEWSDEMKESGPLKREWYDRMKDRGLRVKVALDDAGTVGGMVHYGPIENVPVSGSGLYYLYCIWVHGHKQGRGNFQKRGMGKALLQAAEEDVRQRGGKGLVVWGLSIPVFMRSAWFRKQGYALADSNRMMKLLWKRFADDAEAPRWVKVKKQVPLEKGKVVVTAVRSGWCPAANIAYERAKRAAQELGQQVVFRDIDAFERPVGMEWGASDALYVDDRPVRTGPPPSYEKIRKAIAKKVHRLVPGT